MLVAGQALQATVELVGHGLAVFPVQFVQPSTPAGPSPDACVPGGQMQLVPRHVEIEPSGQASQAAAFQLVL